MVGRKSKFEEIAIAQRYSDLSKDAFDFLKECLQSKNKADKKWAVEQLSKGFQKMIPAQIGGIDGGDIKVTVTNYGNQPALQVHAEELPTSATASD